MLINRRNLTIAKYAGTGILKNGCDLRLLRCATEGTFASDSFLAVHVSPVQRDAFEPLLFDAATVSRTAGIMGNEPFHHQAIAAKPMSSTGTVSAANLESDEEPKASIHVRASLLLRMALAALEFSGGQDIAVTMEVPHDALGHLVFRTNDKVQDWAAYIAVCKGNGLCDPLPMASLTTTDEIIKQAEVAAAIVAKAGI